MLEYIKSVFHVGDSIRITGQEGLFEGTVEHIGSDFLVLKEANDALQGIHLSAIQTFATPNASMPRFTMALHNSIIMPSNIDDQKNLPNRKKNEATATAVGIRTEETQANKPFRQFKPGEKIPLSELQQRDPTLTKQWKCSDQRRRRRELSLQIVGKLRIVLDRIHREHRPEDMEMLRAQGKIIEFQPSFNFAFIDDLSDGERCFLNKSDILDPTIRNETGMDIPVLFTKSRNSKGNTAKSVHRVMTVADAITLAVEVFESGDVYRAVQILTNVQQQCSSNSVREVLDLMNEAREDENPTNRSYEYSRDVAIDKAKECRTAKNYSDAIELYNDALQRGVSKELCIKEIMQLYCSLHNQEVNADGRAKIKEQAVDFIYRYRDELSRKPGILGVLENVYYAFGMYDDHIDVVEDMITQVGRRGDLSKYVFYLNKAALSYLHLNDTERAMDACQQGLEVEPGNPHLLKTLQTIMESPTFGDGN